MWLCHIWAFEKNKISSATALLMLENWPQESQVVARAVNVHLSHLILQASCSLPRTFDFP
jgi:hypothetical protein